MEGKRRVTLVRHGHWIDIADKLYAKFGEHTYVCSVCKEKAESFVGGSENWWCVDKPNFCPNCGAKMDEECKVERLKEDNDG